MRKFRITEIIDFTEFTIIYFAKLLKKRRPKSNNPRHMNYSTGRQHRTIKNKINGTY